MDEDHGLKIQWWQDGNDISGSPTAELDATEVRLWGGDVVVAAFDMQDPEDGWEFLTSDVRRFAEQFEGKTYRTGEHAVAAVIAFHMAQYA